MSASKSPSLSLQAQWFDGHRAQAVLVWLRIDGKELVLESLDGKHVQRYAMTDIDWPERTVHGQRQATLPDGSMLQHDQAAQWDTWWQASGQDEAVVVRWQQSWRASFGMFLGALLLMASSWMWGVPWLSQTIVKWIPPSLEVQLGEAALEQIKTLFLRPSQIPQDKQQALRRDFETLLRIIGSDHEPMPAWRLSFYSAPDLGPNAFALPGGEIILTDEIVQFLAHEPQVLQGILAHEWAHVRHRDGLNMLVRASIFSAMVGVVFGDVSTFLTAVPVVLTQQAYSREVESQADEFAAKMLWAAGMEPALMAIYFERIEALLARQKRGSLPIAISSHPEHAQRIAFFKNWKP